MPAADMTTARTGFPASDSRHDTVDRRGDVVRGRGHRRHEEHDDGVDVRIAEQRGAAPSRTCRPWLRRACRPGSRRSPPPRGARASCPRVSSDSSGSSSPTASQASAQRIPSPPAFVRTADAPALRLRLARQQRADVDQLLERGRADHAGLVEERVDGCVGAGERGRVRARGALPGHGRPALQREDRLASRDPPREPAEPPRVAERLEVEQHDAVCRVVLPPLEQVVRRDVGLVPDRDERREPEPARLRRLENGNAEGAALRREPDVPARREAGGEGRVQRRARDGDPEAVRADQPATVRAHEREQAAPAARAPSAPDLGEAGRDDDERARRLRASACSAASSTALAGSDDDRQVDRRRGSRRRSGTPARPPPALRLG